MMRFPPSGKWLFGAIVALVALAPCTRADYVVLQSGERIHVTGYERVGETLRLTMAGGTLEIPADAVVRVDPEDTFVPVKVKLLERPLCEIHSRLRSKPRNSSRTRSQRDCGRIQLQSKCRFLASRARPDAIDAGNGGAIWRDEGVRSPAKH